MITLCVESRGGGGPLSQLLNHWLHLRYVGTWVFPTLIWQPCSGARGAGGAGSRGLESQIDRQPVPLES